jgi:low affinity Fe/Cu permease
VINTGTTIVTFLMVFLSRTAKQRDSAAVHLKLDELIDRRGAHNALLDLEGSPRRTWSGLPVRVART